MKHFLDSTSTQFGFAYGVQSVSAVAAALRGTKGVFARSVLSNSELAVFEKLRVRKRAYEWLSGRMAAKEAWRRRRAPTRHHVRLPDITVLNDESRAPYIEGDPTLTLSISHSHEYAVAVLAPFKIGVDVERIESRPGSLGTYFCSGEERSVLDAAVGRSADLMTRFWTRKEAVAKLLKLGGALDFRGINTLPDEIVLPDATIKLLSARHADYWIAIAL